MSSALKKEYLPHYTYDDYCGWEGSWELIEGVPYAMSPLPSGKHQWLCGELHALFREGLKNCEGCHVSMPMDWKVDDSTVVQPDIFVACFDFKSLKYISEPPVIIVEVLSPSTRDKDVFVKHAIYRQQGVKYYVLVDPDNDTYKIQRLTGEDYLLAQSGHEGVFTFELHDTCLVQIDFAEIWS